MLVARANLNVAAGAAPVVLRRLGAEAEAARAEERFRRELDAYAEALPARDHMTGLERAVRDRSGVMGLYLMPALPGLEDWAWIDVSRMAEHILVERVALGLLLVLLSLALVLLAGGSVLSGLMRRKTDESAKLLFVGWRRLAVILLLGVALPLGLYALETRVAPWSPLGAGIYKHVAQRLAELAGAFLLVVFTTSALIYRAVRARCVEAGMEVPPPGHFNPLRRPGSVVISLALAGAAGAALSGVVAHVTPRVDGDVLAAFWALVTAVLLPPVFLLWQWRHVGYRSRSLRRLLADFRQALGRTPIWLMILGIAAFGIAGVWGYVERTLWPAGLVLFLLGVGLVLPAVVWAVARTEFRRPEVRLLHFRRSLVRSALPVLAAVAVVLALGAGRYLSWAEARAIAPLDRPGADWYEEVEATDIVRYREHLRRVNQAWLREHVWAPRGDLQTAGPAPRPEPPSS